MHTHEELGAKAMHASKKPQESGAQLLDAPGLDMGFAACSMTSSPVGATGMMPAYLHAPRVNNGGQGLRSNHP